MFFCPGSIGLLNDDDEHNWGDIDNFYNHPSYLTFHHHGGDHDNKFSKMGSLMFVVDCFVYLFVCYFVFFFFFFLFCSMGSTFLFSCRRSILHKFLFLCVCARVCVCEFLKQYRQWVRNSRHRPTTRIAGEIWRREEEQWPAVGDSGHAITRAFVFFFVRFYLFFIIFFRLQEL